MSAGLLTVKPPRRWLDVLVVLACVALALAVTWQHGVDLNWDLQNYHIYSAFSFMHDRLSSEFMAAGMVSYLNPLPMLPFYGMLAAGWHSLAIGIVLALTHSINLVLLWLICRRLFDKVKLGRPLALMAMLIGTASPLFLVEIGTAFADINTCILVLGAVLLLLSVPTQRGFLVAGVLLGAAVGLKLTNVPFAVAAVAFVFVPGASWRERGACLCWLVLGGLAGGVLTGGYWAWVMYQEFHNPVFPLANAFFRSPDFPFLSFTQYRYLPASLQEVLEFPFYLAIPKQGVYTDIFAPDLRFAMGTIAGAVALVAYLLRKQSRGVTVAVNADVGSRKRIWPCFLGYVVLGWLLWLFEFGNGRYFLPLSLLVGPFLCILLAGALPAKRVMLAASICVVLQFGQMYMNGIMTFGDTGKWSERWITLDVPRKLVEQPYLYLGMDIQSNSYFAPFVHPESRFLNVDGMVPLDVVGPGGERVKQQLARFAGATRILVQIYTPPALALASPSFISALDADLNRFGLRVDTGDCVAIVNPMLWQRAMVFEPGMQSNGNQRRNETVLSCGTVPAPQDPVLQASRAEAASLFDKIERSCPRQFPSQWHGVVTRNKNNASWTRYYVDTDLYLHVGAKNVYAEQGRFQLATLGTRAGLINGTERIPCERIRWHVKPTFLLDDIGMPQ